MATYSGRKAKIVVGIGDEQVEEIGNLTINLQADIVDTSSFGTIYKKSDAAMMGWGGSFSGFFSPGTSGQDYLFDAFTNNTLVHAFKFYIYETSVSGERQISFEPGTDSGDGFRITAYSVTQDKASVAAVDFTFEGSGELVINTTLNP